MRKRFGFTLIELLVVIAIIAILAAMLFPVFARARESARKIQCLSNVKNIAIAFQIYLTDYDAFPPSEHRAEVLSYFNSGPGGGAPASFVTGCLQDNLVHPNPYLAWPGCVALPERAARSRHALGGSGPGLAGLSEIDTREMGREPARLRGRAVLLRLAARLGRVGDRFRRPAPAVEHGHRCLRPEHCHHEELRYEDRQDR
jgi:prepilin-type N-terminal cleavage/methylation domain-containing protein